MKKIYVTPHQQVSITCDECFGTYTSAAPKHVRGNAVVKARCRCGKDLEVIFEFRQAYRKPTQLHGQLQPYGTHDGRQAIQVHNLSQKGIQFATRAWRKIQPGDVLTLTFALDNPQRSKIDKQVEVKYVGEQMIGAQFCAEDEYAYQKEIGYYLMG